MKKYTALVIITLLILALAAVAPDAATTFLPQVELVNSKSTVYTQTVTATGNIMEKSKKDIITDYPIVPDSIRVELGDTVQTGDVIATVDKSATETALLSMKNNAPNSLSPDLISVMSQGDEGLNLLSTQIPNEIVASASGTITSLNLVEGSLSAMNTAVVTIAKTDQLCAKIAVSEAHMLTVKAGQPVTLTGSGFKGLTYHGTIEKVYPTARKQLTGTTQETVVDVLVQLNDADEKLKSGFSVTAQIQLDDPKQVQIIPYDAISQDENGKEYLYVYQRGRAVRREIRTGIELADGIEILSGLQPNEPFIYQASSLTGDWQYVALKK